MPTAFSFSKQPYSAFCASARSFVHLPLNNMHTHFYGYASVFICREKMFFFLVLFLSLHERPFMLLLKLFKAEKKYTKEYKLLCKRSHLAKELSSLCGAFFVYLFSRLACHGSSVYDIH